MRNKNLIFLLVLICAVIVIALIGKQFVAKKPTGKAPVSAKAEKKAAPAPSKKVITEGMGALTVTITDSRNKNLNLKLRAFKSIDAKSGVYEAAFISNRQQELLPGNYDIEIDTVPQLIRKGIKVVKGEERIEDLGCVTGSVNIKALNAKKKDAGYPIKIFYPRSNIAVATGVTNRPVEIVSSLYGVEIGTSPRQFRKDVKIESGKQVVLDLGCVTGSLLVKGYDENNKALAYLVRISQAGNKQPAATATTNRAVEILPGMYDIEVLSTPKQVKSGLKINAGEETVVEVLIPTPPVKPKK